MQPITRVVLSVVAVFMMAAPVASADEQMTPLASQGNWMAMEHSDSITDPPDVCLAISLDGLAIRTDQTDNEIRFINPKWSLPASVSGSLTLNVNSKKFALDITNNTDTMVGAEVPTDQLQSIIGEMNKAGSLTVRAGSAAPITVSLDGSNVAISAYLTCANISPPAGDTPAGANPFAGSTTSP